MNKGLNVHLAGPLGAVGKDLKDRQFKVIRFDVESAIANLYAVYAEARENNMRLLPIVETVDHVLALPVPASSTYCGVEVLNEPNVGNQFTPDTYVEHALPIIEAALTRGLTPWVGGIYNTHKESQAWLAEVLRRLPDNLQVGVTVHRYPWGSTWQSPAKGFATREAETVALLQVIGDRPFGVSEFGFTEERLCKWRFSWRFPFLRRECQEWSSHDVLTLIRQEFAWWESYGAQFAVVYQLNNGPIGSAEQYGMRTFPEGLWKPQAECCV